MERMVTLTDEELAAVIEALGGYFHEDPVLRAAVQKLLAQQQYNEMVRVAAEQRLAAMASDDEEDAYELSDPKHPRHREVYADAADFATKGEA